MLPGKDDQGVLCMLRTAKGSKGCSSAADDGWLGITPLTFEQLGQEQSGGVYIFATHTAPKRVPAPSSYRTFQIYDLTWFQNYVCTRYYKYIY